MRMGLLPKKTGPNSGPWTLKSARQYRALRHSRNFILTVTDVSKRVAPNPEIIILISFWSRIDNLSYGRKYTANLSVALEDKYNELPQFTLSIGGLNSPSTTRASTSEKDNTETKEISPSSSPAPSPTPIEPQEPNESNKRCIWFICW